MIKSILYYVYSSFHKMWRQSMKFWKPSLCDVTVGYYKLGLT